MRDLTDKEIAWKSGGTRDYQELVRICRETLRPADPLTEPEPGRRRIGGHYTMPLHLRRSGG